jgi:hypothetical protein
LVLIATLHETDYTLFLMWLTVGAAIILAGNVCFVGFHGPGQQTRLSIFA